MLMYIPATVEDNTLSNNVVNDAGGAAIAHLCLNIGVTAPG